MLLSSIVQSERPVLLALHQYPRCLERSGATMPEDIHIVEPLGYRTSLALQLHAAAVLTDSGGVQREAAWLGVPCLVLRVRTEWTEAVEDSEGRMVLVGRDQHRVQDALDRVAPESAAADLARERAANASIIEAGAAEAIAEALRS